MDLERGIETNNDENVHQKNMDVKYEMDNSARYQKISTIGLCENGDVSYSKQIENNQDVAIKRIHKCLIRSEQEAIGLCKRLQWMKSLKHPFILAIDEILQDEKTISIVSEFCLCGNLFGYLETFSYLSESQVKFIAIQLIEAIYYLHSNNCIFCGLQAENVLVAKDGYVRLTGFSKSLVNTPTPYYGITGFLEYLSPEMLLNKGIDYSYDWYQLGCLLYELIEGHLPFASTTTTSILQKILLNKIEYQRASKDAQRFISMLLHPDPSIRSKFIDKDIKKHEWLKEFTWKNVINKAIPSPLIRVSIGESSDCYYPHFKEDIIEEGNNPEFFNSVFLQYTF